MASNYARLYKAALILTGPGSIQERLGDAFRSEVQYLNPSELPEPLRVELETIQDELTKAEASGERDRIEMSASELSDRQAADLSMQLLEVYDEVTRARPDARRPLG